MCNFCCWGRRDRLQPQLKKNLKNQSAKTSKVKAPTKKQSKVIASKVPSTIPSDDNLLADLPSSSVQTIQIPGSGLQPVEDSNIFKWKQFKDKVESSVKRMKLRLSQLTSKKKVTEGKTENDSPEEEDTEKVHRHYLSPLCFGCQGRRRSLRPRSKHSPHQKKKKKTPKTPVDHREKENRKKTKDKTSPLTPSSHSPNQPLISFSSTPSTNDAVSKLKTAKVPHSEGRPVIKPTSATSPTTELFASDQKKPLQKFTAGLDSESSSKSISSNQSDWDGKYYSKIDSENTSSHT